MALLCVRLGERHRVAFIMFRDRATAVVELLRVWVTLKLTIPIMFRLETTTPLGPTLWRTTFT